jgi:Na+/H+ antiporter NhaD/arsenite permease-like protein
LFRSAFVVDPDQAQDVGALDERRAIRDPALLWRVPAVLVLILVAFGLHSVLGLDPSVVALLGAGAMILVSGAARSEFLQDVEWETLVFFSGLFVMVGALVNIGVINWLGQQATQAVGGHLLLAVTVLLFGSA